MTLLIELMITCPKCDDEFANRRALSGHISGSHGALTDCPEVRDSLFRELHRVNELVDGQVSKADINEHGAYSSNLYQSVFESWNHAKRSAGLETVPDKVDKQTLIQGLVEFAEELGRTPRAADMEESGPFAVSTYQNHFDTWNNVLKAAGLELNRTYRPDEEELIQELQRLENELGRTPTRDDIEENSRFSSTPYRNVFGNLTKAKIEAGITLSKRNGSGREANKDELIEEIHRIHDLIDDVPTLTDIERLSEYSATPFYRLFSTFGEALEQAGFESRTVEYNKERVINEIKEVSEHVDGVPIKEDFIRLSNISQEPVYTHFGGWNEALRACDMTPNQWSVSKEQVLDEIHRLARIFDRTPKKKEFDKHAPFSRSGLRHHFGSWNLALEAAGLELNQESTEEVNCDTCGTVIVRNQSDRERNDNHFCGRECYAEYRSEHIRGENHPQYKHGESSNLFNDPSDWEKKRKQVLEKYGRECVSCYISEAEHLDRYGMSLHIHHIEPRSQFMNDDGEINWEMANRIQNLIPLCSKCHNKYESLPIRPQIE